MGLVQTAHQKPGGSEMTIGNSEEITVDDLFSVEIEPLHQWRNETVMQGCYSVKRVALVTNNCSKISKSYCLFDPEMGKKLCKLGEK
jgi:hypothetical protein